MSCLDRNDREIKGCHAGNQHFVVRNALTAWRMMLGVVHVHVRCIALYRLVGKSSHCLFYSLAAQLNDVNAHWSRADALIWPHTPSDVILYAWSALLVQSHSTQSPYTPYCILNTCSEQIYSSGPYNIPGRATAVHLPKSTPSKGLRDHEQS